MQTDLCALCVENTCVLPSIESIGRRLQDPKAYFIFYMYFYTAAVGEVRWKECMAKKETRIGSNTTEAFALLVLVNNYKAWLYEEKKKHKTDLWTEYDCSPSYGKPSIVDKILDGVQFNLETDISAPVLIYDKENSTYKKMEKERVEWLENFCKTGECIRTNDEVLKKATTDTRERCEDAEAEAVADDQFLLKERKRKKRKLTRELREFTGASSQGERKHKGWSDQGMVTFEKYVKAIRKDVEEHKYIAWETAYRNVMEKLDHSERPDRDPVQRERYQPDLSIVYEGF